MFVQPFEQITQAVHDDLMRNDDDAPLRIIAAQHFDETAQAQDDVAPALAARRTEIELADQTPLFGEFRKFVDDAALGEAVEDAEFFFAQTLVDADCVIVATALQVW